MAPHAQDRQPAIAPATLGDILYAGDPETADLESEWVGLVHAVAAGDQLALHALYDRAHRLVFTLALRISGSRETAEELTVDIFYDLWRRASDYDPANGTVLGWIMIQARSRAIDRHRFDHRCKRVNPDQHEAQAAEEAALAEDALQLEEERNVLRLALRNLSPGEREAIEAAFFSGLSHAEVAVRLHEPLGTVKTRIRSGLQKLRLALAGEGVRR